MSPKVILITGCSSGFGLLTAARLASRGHHVYATMRNLTKNNALQNEALKRNAQCSILELDVTDSGSIENCIQTIKNERGYIDVLINNAGFGLGGAFEDLNESEIRAIMETNFFGVQNVTRRVIPLMRQRRQGKIINISSISGFMASPCFSAYNCSKWALEAFSESLRYELQFFGIDVLLVQPGSYRTKIFEDNAQYAKNFNNADSPYFELSKHLHKRMMENIIDNHKDPEEVAELIEKLINKKKPSFRNIPDIEGRVLYILRKFLPFSIFSWLVRRNFTQNLELEDIREKELV